MSDCGASESSLISFVFNLLVIHAVLLFQLWPRRLHFSVNYRFLQIHIGRFRSVVSVAALQHSVRIIICFQSSYKLNKIKIRLTLLFCFDIDVDG